MDGFENVTSDGGLKKKLLWNGKGGICPSKGQKVKVNYTGYFADTGKVFDESKNKVPFEFMVGIGQVIKGWDLAVLGMQKHEESEFLIRSDYAYGEAGISGVIPKNCDLKFRIELIDFK